MEKAMAPHFSTLAWKIPWMGEPGGLQSMGLLRSDMTERLHFHFSLSCIGEGNGNVLHYSCLENPRDGGAWWAAIYGVTQSLTQLKWLSRKGVYVIIMELKSKRSNVLISKDCWCQSLWPLSLKHCFFGGRGAGGWHATDLSWYYLVSYHHPAIRPLTGSSRKESDKSDRYQLVPHVYNYFLSLRQRIFLMPCSSS